MLKVTVVEQCFWSGSRRRVGSTLEIETDDLPVDAGGNIEIPKCFEKDPGVAAKRIAEIASRPYRAAVESCGKAAEVHHVTDPRKHHV